MNQPTDLQRVQWWRDGWRRKYNQAADTDRMTVAIERREWAAVVRYWQVKRAVDGLAGGTGKRCDD